VAKDLEKEKKEVSRTLSRGESNQPQKGKAPDDIQGVADNRGCRTDLRTPEGRAAILAARMAAPKKSVFVRAILRHCHECYGKHPSREDCGGNELMDGTSCNLYRFNSAGKCRRATKSTLKKAIRAECRYCFDGAGKCPSSKCNLFGR